MQKLADFIGGEFVAPHGRTHLDDIDKWELDPKEFIVSSRP